MRHIPQSEQQIRLVGWTAIIVRRIESAVNRVFSSRWNPLYQSGTIAIAAFIVMLITGLYLFIFYGIDAPYASVHRIENELWLGQLMRSSHRYAADVAIIAAVWHAIKMFSMGKYWGARALAWVSGLILLGSLVICGWTGMIMAWDLQGQWLAVELARIVNALPIFSEPLTRLFDGRSAVPSSFFFMNLFLHVSLPLGTAFLFLIHIFRIARPKYLPPRELFWGVTIAIIAAAAIAPVPLLPRANLLAAFQSVPIDIYYSFWLPLSQIASPLENLLVWVLLFLLASSIPWSLRPRKAVMVPSYVNPKLCTGCSTCYEDCPFDAISMFARNDASPLSDFVAKVDPAKCVSCGICAGSCAPMGVGPGKRTGRDQLSEAKSLFAEGDDLIGKLVVVTCMNGPGQANIEQRLPDAVHLPADCAGSVHTAILEYAIRRGALGAVVVTCPPRDAPCREGPKWVEQRLYFEREAELKPRVDKRQVLLLSGAIDEIGNITQACLAFEQELLQFVEPKAESTVDIDTLCEPITELPE